jgi:hypothetical protein
LRPGPPCRVVVTRRFTISRRALLRAPRQAELVIQCGSPQRPSVVISRCRSKSDSLTVSVGRRLLRPGSSPWERLGLISDPACPPAGVTAGGARRTEAAASGPAPGCAQRPQTRPYGNRPAPRCRLGDIMPVALRLPPPLAGTGILVGPLSASETPSQGAHWLRPGSVPRISWPTGRQATRDGLAPLQ